MGRWFVASAVVSSVAQPISLFSHAKTQAPPRDENGSTSPGAGTDGAKDGMPITVDRVSISFQSRQAMTDVQKEKTAIEESEREKAIKEAASRRNSGKSDGAAAKVQFVYDLNGELSIRYMDASDRLVYQSPSELMLQMKEAASKSDSSVDTEA